MSHKLSKDDFHKIILVVCRGSEDREEFNFVIDQMFELDNDQRNYYWESYSEAQGILKVLNLLGANVSLSTEHLKEEGNLPDNVTPIRPEVL